MTTTPRPSSAKGEMTPALPAALGTACRGSTQAPAC
eukprot:CAMPEP_0204362168 /NCGR_PEP_ID=MMETSP0469-20131031/39390_1 /ASSEMBLY_ACC=CAM_ASM_000384 /TAXON_ID=2969 /ORGANISM="Oxyrrhis marina" /LENGTH=35 /DNA_ID= /DNA_START= /DNA_END= /DNA_ORIENTATION=